MGIESNGVNEIYKEIYKAMDQAEKEYQDYFLLVKRNGMEAKIYTGDSRECIRKNLFCSEWIPMKVYDCERPTTGQKVHLLAYIDRFVKSYEYEMEILKQYTAEKEKEEKEVLFPIEYIGDEKYLVWSFKQHRHLYLEEFVSNSKSFVIKENLDSKEEIPGDKYAIYLPSRNFINDVGTYLINSTIEESWRKRLPKLFEV